MSRLILMPWQSKLHVILKFLLKLVADDKIDRNVPSIEKARKQINLSLQFDLNTSILAALRVFIMSLKPVFC